MIFITYKTTELKAYNKNTHEPNYIKINKFLEPLSLVKNGINKANTDKIISAINDSEEQIYFEPVQEDFKYDDNLNLVSFWKDLFNKAEEMLKKAKENQKADSEKKNEIIIINQSEILGQWQSIELLTGLRHFSRVFWINVDNFLSVVNKVLDEYKSGDLSTKKTFFIKELRKKCKCVFPNTNEKL